MRFPLPATLHLRRLPAQAEGQRRRLSSAWEQKGTLQPGNPKGTVHSNGAFTRFAVIPHASSANARCHIVCAGHWGGAYIYGTQAGVQYIESILKEKFLDDAAKHAHGYSSNMVESLNNIIHKAAPKRLNLSKSYVGRADVAILTHELGHTVRTRRCG